MRKNDNELINVTDQLWSLKSVNIGDLIYCIFLDIK